jgi:hypothetical protein
VLVKCGLFPVSWHQLKLTRPSPGVSSGADLSCHCNVTAPLPVPEQRSGNLSCTITNMHGSHGASSLPNSSFRFLIRALHPPSEFQLLRKFPYPGRGTDIPCSIIRAADSANHSPRFFPANIVTLAKTPPAKQSPSGHSSTPFLRHKVHQSLYRLGYLLMDCTGGSGRGLLCSAGTVCEESVGNDTKKLRQLVCGRCSKP